MHVEYGVLDHGLCVRWSVRVFRHITYMATGILTQVHAAMWVKDIPHTSSWIATNFSYGVFWEPYSWEYVYNLWLVLIKKNEILYSSMATTCMYTGSSLSVEC